MNTQCNLNQELKERWMRHKDELKWLYMELYSGQDQAYDNLLQRMEEYYEVRGDELKELDRRREKEPDWYKQNDLVGMMLYVDAFAGNLKGVEKKLDYIRDCNVNYLHLMPLLDTTEGKSDGGYAVSDFRKVRADLGQMADLEALTAKCHKQDISVCLDFVMNHTSEDHEWARRARAGEKEYQDRYYFYDNYDIPEQFERTVPQVFPQTAPGNFTWLPDMDRFVMTTFYPYQWDLNYWNPVVFNEMVFNMLNLANKGIDIIRLDAVPYIWKELGTNCRNLPRVHTVVRMMRMITEIVCPGVLLLGEVVMEPSKVVPYFGTIDKPECHMLYNVTTMASTWHTVATKDVRLLKRQMDIVNALPKNYVFLNYLRCHDDIGWGLDYPWLRQFGWEEVAHKRFLNDYFTGQFPGSVSRGELYNDDPALGDARLCGTCASLCGVEKAGFEGDADAMQEAVDYDVMLHAYMLTQSGVPVIYSGDEIGQCNDYSYHKDPHKWEDSRYLHRGKMNWERAKLRREEGTVEYRIFTRLGELVRLHKKEEVFNSQADVWTIDAHDNAILSMIRQKGRERLIALFNFSYEDKTAWIQESGTYQDMITGECMEAVAVPVPKCGFRWLKRKKE